MSYTTSLIKEGMKAIREASQDYSQRPARVDTSVKPLKVDSNFQPNRSLTQPELSYVNEPFFNRYSVDPSYESNQRVNTLLIGGGEGRLGRDEIMDIRSVKPSDTSNMPSVRAAKGLETLKKLAPKLKAR